MVKNADPPSGTDKEITTVQGYVKKQLFKSRFNKYRHFKFSSYSFNVPALKFCPRSAEITINKDD